MKTLNENNRNPRYEGVPFWDVHKLLIEDGGGVASLHSRVGVGNNTVARFRRVGHDDPQAIEVHYYETLVAVLYDDDRVQLWTGGYKTASTETRLDWVLLPLGYRLTMVGKTWKVYSIKTGSYRDFSEGMIVGKGDF